MVNVFGIKCSIFERERYVFCCLDVVLESKFDYLFCINLDSWVVVIFSCYKNLFWEKILFFLFNCVVYWVVNIRL